MKKTFNELWKDLENGENGELYAKVNELSNDIMAVIQDLVVRNNRLAGRVARQERKIKKLEKQLQEKRGEE